MLNSWPELFRLNSHPQFSSEPRRQRDLEDRSDLGRLEHSRKLDTDDRAEWAIRHRDIRHVEPHSRSVSASTDVDSVVFNADASAFTISQQGLAIRLVMDGAGVLNNSGLTQNFVDRGTGGEILFRNNSSAGTKPLMCSNKTRMAPADKGLEVCFSPSPPVRATARSRLPRIHSAMSTANHIFL
jgi:hypothetical protein